MSGLTTFLGGLKAPSYALFRIMFGLLFMVHGTQKLFAFPSAFPYELSGMSYAAAVIELVFGLLVAIGFQTRLSAFIASGMSAVGYWLVHGTQNLFPINNGGEVIALYCFAFLVIATHGAGIWSVDGED